MLTSDFDSRLLWSITIANFYQRLKVRVVSKQNCPSFQKMSKISIVSTPEAVKLHISKWPKYCETARHPVQWNDCSEDNSGAHSRGFNIAF